LPIDAFYEREELKSFDLDKNRLVWFEELDKPLYKTACTY